MTIKKLQAMPYAQAHVEIHDDGTIVLVSYYTVVAVIYPEKWVEVFGLYSATTRRHLGAFAKEYCGLDYQTLKTIYYDNMILNIETGEVLDKS